MKEGNGEGGAIYIWGSARLHGIVNSIKWPNKAGLGGFPTEVNFDLIPILPAGARHTVRWPAAGGSAPNVLLPSCQPPLAPKLRETERKDSILLLALANFICLLTYPPLTILFLGFGALLPPGNLPWSPGECRNVSKQARINAGVVGIPYPEETAGWTWQKEELLGQTTPAQLAKEGRLTSRLEKPKPVQLHFCTRIPAEN